jgi:DNA-binding MarR family transcriptional regulator
LQEAGLVVRQRHPTDGRATLVGLTARGKRVAAALRADQERFGKLLFDGVRDADVKTFMATLDQVLARLHDMRSQADDPEVGV